MEKYVIQMIFRVISWIVFIFLLNLQKLSTTNTSKVMGKSVVLLLLSVCSISVYAQREWESLLQDGKVWTMEYSNVYSEQCDYSDVVLRSDTVIDGIPFKSSDGLFWIGQKDGVIYQYEEFFNLGQVCPIMDFSLNVGDEFVIYEKEYDEDADTVATWVLDKLDVIAVSDTVLASSTDRSQRHCVYVKSLRNNQQQECWVEGIGSLTYGILGYRVGWYGSSKRLFQCKQGDEVLYAADTTASIRPSLKQKNSKEIFFDLQGRRINGEPKRGLYIRAGKKVIKF